MEESTSKPYDELVPSDDDKLDNIKPNAYDKLNEEPSDENSQRVRSSTTMTWIVQTFPVSKISFIRNLTRS